MAEVISRRESNNWLKWCGATILRMLHHARPRLLSQNSRRCDLAAHVDVFSRRHLASALGSGRSSAPRAAEVLERRACRVGLKTGRHSRARRARLHRQISENKKTPSRSRQRMSLAAVYEQCGAPRRGNRGRPVGRVAAPAEGRSAAFVAAARATPHDHERS